MGGSKFVGDSDDGSATGLWIVKRTARRISDRVAAAGSVGHCAHSWDIGVKKR